MFDDNGSFLLAMFEFFIFMAWLLCMFWVFGDIFRSRDLGGFAKTMWVLFIVILPLLGMLVYVIARGNGMSDRALAATTEARQRQDAYIRSVAGSDGRPGGTPTDEIASAKALLDSGAIDESEFLRLKAGALAKAGSPAVA
jgi:hypothetical protein